MSLTEIVKQFMYTHMQQAPHCKELLKLIDAGESEYKARIKELEDQLAAARSASPAGSRVDESLKNETPDPFDHLNWNNFD